MIKSRLKRLEEKMTSHADEKVFIIEIHSSLLPVITRLKGDKPLLVKKPGETKEEFRERVRKEGHNTGVWAMSDEEMEEVNKRKAKNRRLG